MTFIEKKYSELIKTETGEDVELTLESNNKLFVLCSGELQELVISSFFVCNGKKVTVLERGIVVTL